MILLAAVFLAGIALGVVATSIVSLIVMAHDSDKRAAEMFRAMNKKEGA